jgi:PTH1 family peptidyl-tRNA hydrolase
MYYIVGLGNPGEEYGGTRHNTGRMIVEDFAKKQKAPWVFDKKSNALKSEGRAGKEKMMLLLPETFMNNSGDAVAKVITSKKRAEKLIVIHDDLDLPLGKFKISFAKSSGGHKGVESVIKKIKTDRFIRIRAGTSPKKKPQGKDLIKFLMGKFTPKELSIFKKTSKKITSAIEMIITEGLQKAMNEFN